MFDIILLELLIFLTIFIISRILWFFRTRSEHTTVYMIIGFLGVFIHEVCHLTANLFTGIRPRSFAVKRGRYDYYGYVGSSIHRSLLKSILICFAPLYLSTWLIYYLLIAILSPSVAMIYKYIAVFLIISALVGASPSNQDLKNISRAYSRDPSYSALQVTLVILSFGIAYLLIIVFSIPITLTIFYYLIAWIGYLLFKYSILGIIYIVRVHNKEQISPQNKATVRRKPGRRRHERRAQW
jgi:hypothetical protein